MVGRSTGKKEESWKVDGSVGLMPKESLQIMAIIQRQVLVSWIDPLNPKAFSVGRIPPDNLLRNRELLFHTLVRRAFRKVFEVFKHRQQGQGIWWRVTHGSVNCRKHGARRH